MPFSSRRDAHPYKRHGRSRQHATQTTQGCKVGLIKQQRTSTTASNTIGPAVSSAHTPRYSSSSHLRGESSMLANTLASSSSTSACSSSSRGTDGDGTPLRDCRCCGRSLPRGLRPTPLVRFECEDGVVERSLRDSQRALSTPPRTGTAGRHKADTGSRGATSDATSREVEARSCAHHHKRAINGQTITDAQCTRRCAWAVRIQSPQSPNHFNKILSLKW